MGQVRKSTMRSKVERWHGFIRREAGISKEGNSEEYVAGIREYVAFYDRERPPWSCSLKTPKEVFREGLSIPLPLGLAMSRDSADPSGMRLFSMSYYEQGSDCSNERIL